MKIFLLSLLGVAVVSGGWIFFSHAIVEEKKSTENVYHDEKEARLEMEGRYYNERFGFSLLLPDGARASERMEGRGTVTITIEGTTDQRGFQIFITPYSEPVITKERFLADSPLGVYLEEEKTLVAGIPALSFKGQDQRLGDTKEVWFIHEGNLYEVTSLYADSAYLSEILTSWRAEK